MIKRFWVFVLVVCSILVCRSQTFNLFAPEVKSAYPSVVYDFLERYLYEIDSLQTKRVSVDQRLRDDKVLFVKGNAASAKDITPQMPCSISSNYEKYYEVIWTDTLNNTILHIAFPMQYELLLGMPKIEIEKNFQSTLAATPPFKTVIPNTDDTTIQSDSCRMTLPVSHYYIESLNNSSYFHADSEGEFTPVFSTHDKWHSAANLFLGCIDNIADYKLHVEQRLYGFNKMQYTVNLSQWLSYCMSMKLDMYFAIEEECEDGLKALLIAHSSDLGFNHMMSIIIPYNFVEKPNSVFKATLNAYIPIQNVKDLYQQYVKKPKKKF